LTQSPISNLQPPISNLQSPILKLVIFLLCLVALLPLLRGVSPCSHDGALHYFRVVTMHHALKQGLLFSRWLPDLAFGYGFPFFNYRAPLPYYLALGLHLTGLPLPLALNLLYVLSILGCAMGAYLLARDLFGPEAGVVAAVAYAYAPYQFLDALLRANGPESAALALLPFVLWAFRRLALKGGRRWFLVATGLLATLYLTHNISSLLFTPFLMAYLGLLGWVHRRRGRWGWVALALGLALGLSAFFWLPALAEKGYVQLYLTRATRNNDFHFNFLKLAEIFAPPAPVDTSLMNPPMEIHLGLAQAMLAGLGLVMGLLPLSPPLGGMKGGRPSLRGESPQAAKCSRERRAVLLFFAASAALFVFLSTRSSLWLWEHLPLLPFVQFPWRFVGRAALPVALLTAGLAPPPSFPPSGGDEGGERNTPHVSRFTPHVSRIWLPITISALILAALPYTYPPLGYCPAPAHPTVSDVHRYERQSRLVGVDPLGAYFPIWVQQRPEESPLETQYAAGGTIARFDGTALPEGAAILEAEYGPNHARLVVESPVPFCARYLTFYFPGWRAWVGGEPVEVRPSKPEGLITFDVPAGRAHIHVRFGETRLRLAADALSLLSLLALVVLAVRAPRPKDPSPRPPGPSVPLSPSHQVTWSLLLVSVLLLAFKWAIVDRVDTPFRHPFLQADGALPGVEHLLNQPYADGLTLIGYDQSPTTLPADGTLRLDLYWTAHTRPSARYQTVIHLVGPDGLRWSLADSYRPRGYPDYPPTPTWSPGRYALDGHATAPLPGTPPGVYDVVLTIFDRDTLAPLSMLNEQGQPAAPTLILGQVTLTGPGRPANPDALGARHRLDLPCGPLTLLGAEFDRDQAAPGDLALLTTFWRADQQPAQDLTVHLALLTPDGSRAAEYDLPPTAPWHPTSTWQIGDVWRGQHILHLPATLDTAAYTWTLSLPPSSCPPVPLSSISTTAPPHTFAPPPVDVETNTRLGNVATLIGATLEPRAPSTHLPIYPSTHLTVTLVWRAEATAADSYHVFLHLLGPEGKLTAQSDGIPANWTRPTTGWLPGEYIADAHVLTAPADAPPGNYILQAGLYMPGGKRLTTPDGADAVQLAIITVGDQ